jgi:peptidase, S41 family
MEEKDKKNVHRKEKNNDEMQKVDIENKEIDTEDKKGEEDDQNSSVREIIVEKKVGFNYLEVILIMIITLIIGGFLGGFVNQFVTKPTKQESSTVSDEFQEFLNTYEDIKENYYEEIDEGEMLNAGIKGMIDYLGDKYSVYMDEEETEEFNEQVEGKYVGIGTEIMQLEDGSVVVSNPFEGSPAAKAGLQAGDVIIRVNDTDVTGKTSSEVSNLIKKSADSTVNITVRRDDEEKTFTIERETIEIESVDSSVFDVNDKKVGYIYISIFAANTYQQFEQALEDLEKDGIDSLVIDVRSNSGGYLDCVTEIASLFLGKGKVIYQLDTKGIVEKVYDETKTKRDYPIAVLINSSSASASEILAASLKESYGAEVVGVNSYGKGTVQRAYQLENGATVKYTIQKWLTPDGNWINEVGVEPTLRVEMNVDYYQNPSDETDNQLQEALKKVAE